MVIPTSATVPECPDCTMPAQRPDGLCHFCAAMRANTARGACALCGARSPKPADNGDGTYCEYCREEVEALAADYYAELRAEARAAREA